MSHVTTRWGVCGSMIFSHPRRGQGPFTTSQMQHWQQARCGEGSECRSVFSSFLRFCPFSSFKLCARLLTSRARLAISSQSSPSGGEENHRQEVGSCLDHPSGSSGFRWPSQEGPAKVGNQRNRRSTCSPGLWLEGPVVRKVDRSAEVQRVWQLLPVGSALPRGWRSDFFEGQWPEKDLDAGALLAAAGHTGPGAGGGSSCAGTESG